jgi:predicted MFS family arabinose efflux permease/quinol monooxygenase YgiN
MSDVGQGWLMTSLAVSPLMVALVVTAESLPYVLFGLVAGALADVVDRRRLLIVTQALMAVAVGGLAAWTLLGTITPWGLLALVAALGLATGLNDPAWYALPGELVPEGEVAAAITLHGAGLNVGRTIGPAVGGAIVATAGPGIAFALDAVTYLAVIGVLLAWRRPHTPSVLPAERIAAAVRSGLRYARHSAPLRRVIFHGLGFMTCGIIVLALMPVLARRTEQGALALGLLLGAMGVGALVGTALLPRLRVRTSLDGVVAVGTVVFAAAIAGAAWCRSLVLLVPLLLAAGAGWIAVLSSLNIAAQRASPAWVKARSIAVFLMFLQVGIAAGSALWGAVASRAGLEVAYTSAALGLALGLLVLWRRPLAVEQVGDLLPAHHWAEPVVASEARLEDGPVMVQVEFLVEPGRVEEFVRAMEAVGRSRRRYGAIQWWLFRDSAEPTRFVETWVQETWGEHLRQHERVSVADRELEARAIACLVEKTTPPARHFLPPLPCPSCDSAATVVQAGMLGGGGRP